jgi:hypothetical protein
MAHNRYCPNCERLTKHVYVNSDKTLDICMEQEHIMKDVEREYEIKYDY